LVDIVLEGKMANKNVKLPALPCTWKQYQRDKLQNIKCSHLLAYYFIPWPYKHFTSIMYHLLDIEV